MFPKPYADIVARLRVPSGFLIVVVFAWLNLVVMDAFSTGEVLLIDFTGSPMRDLSLSLAWAAFALALLVIGMRLRSAALRWTSLGLVLATAGKIFLFDLAYLKDLYRVASLVGLAASLIFISALYQRFVLRSERAASTG